MENTHNTTTTCNNIGTINNKHKKNQKNKMAKVSDVQGFSKDIVDDGKNTKPKGQTSSPDCNIHPVTTNKFVKSNTFPLQHVAGGMTNHWQHYTGGKPFQTGPRNCGHAHHTEREDSRKWYPKQCFNSGNSRETCFRRYNSCHYTEKRSHGLVTNGNYGSRGHFNVPTFVGYRNHMSGCRNHMSGCRTHMPADNRPFAGCRTHMSCGHSHMPISNQTCEAYSIGRDRKDAASEGIKKKWVAVSKEGCQIFDKTTSPADCCYILDDKNTGDVDNKTVPADLCKKFEDNLTNSSNSVTISYPKSQLRIQSAPAMSIKNTGEVDNKTVPADMCKILGDNMTYSSNNVINCYPKSQIRVQSAPAVLISDDKKTGEVENFEIAKEFTVSFGSFLEHVLPLESSSVMVDPAITAAYTLQLLSGIGCPVSKFENFIHCATPSIFSSYSYKKCPICCDNEISYSLLCNHQIPNVSLHDFWSWYEKPGNYGLEVKVESSKKSTSFYFAPSLSAVQLFGYSHFSNFGGPSIELLERELLFEFFETDQPHLRKTIYNKIKELVNSGTPNLQLFGDPSTLVTLNLNDLHPASWFSVAWYPIYQLPDGKFRASFLTFHSLGHLIQNDFLDKKGSSIICPVLGMQSYNAEGECWFEAPLTNILTEHLKILEENSKLFARGCICKNNTIVSNWHSDYEFFNSRKR
ncbi:hypothetical protein ACFE04_018427 [Oxalis oulophora]